jgi:hypothetical protein
MGQDCEGRKGTSGMIGYQTPNKQFQRSGNSRLRRLLPPAELRRSASR